MTRKLKKRAWWWSWSEWAAAGPDQRQYLGRLRETGWGDGGRIEMVEFADGSSEIRIPCRDTKDGASRMTRVITIDAPEAK